MFNSTTRVPAGGGAKPARGGDTGDYKLLYEYLRDRYADRIVLTFGQIEDLIGFPLPGAARLDKSWWAGPSVGVPRSAQSDAWSMANRTATVNIAPQSVLFERALPAA